MSRNVGVILLRSQIIIVSLAFVLHLLKVMTVSEVFAKQLMQISGVSPDKAVAILEKYPTPKRYIHSTFFLSC